jgi:hypothetical protein
MAQMQDNISFMKEFQPLSDEEFAAVRKVQEIFQEDRWMTRHIIIYDS